MKRIFTAVLMTAIACVLVMNVTALHHGGTAATAIQTAERAAAAAPSPSPEARVAVVTEHKSKEAEQFLWDCLNRYSPSEEITAGVLAYFWRESFFRSDATAGWSYSTARKGYDYALEFTRSIDRGLEDGSTKEEFIDQTRRVTGGYGLGQWSAYHYLDAFYDFAQDWGTSIGDAEMQCAFVLESLQQDEELWKDLLRTTDPYVVGWKIASDYDGTSSGRDYIASMARIFYREYASQRAVSTAA